MLKRYFGTVWHIGLTISGLMLVSANLRSVCAQLPTEVTLERYLSHAKTIGMTTPSDKATLAPLVPARLAAIHAEEGSMVHKNDILIELSDTAQRVKTQIARASADAVWRVELARMEWEEANLEVERLTNLHDHATSKELNQAAMMADTKRFELDAAQFRHEQDQRIYQRELARLEEYRIRAPFDGYVASMNKKVGETVDTLEKVATLVKLDPLEVVLDCPIEWVPKLKVGHRFPVRPTDGQWAMRVGQIRLINRVADAASQTVKVKLIIPNQDLGWLVGLKVEVDFSTPRSSKTSAHLIGHRTTHLPTGSKLSKERHLENPRSK